MKKILSAMMVMLLLVSLFTGCAKKDEAPAATSDNSTKTEATADTKTEEPAKEAEATGGKIVVGFSQCGAESGWRTAETDSFKKTAEEDPDVELQFSDAQGQQENQIKAIRNFIAQGVDAIVLAPIVESGWDTVLQEAKDAGIPVFLVDRGVQVADESLYVTKIASDFIEEGKMAANYLIEKFGKDASLNIVELQGTVGASAATDRKTGFEQGIEGLAGYKITQSQTGDFARAKGKEVMEAFLKSGEKIDVLYAHNDDMAVGAIQAIEEAGLKPGTDIVIVSIDGVKDIFQAIADGKANCTVECTPLLAPQTFQAIKDTLAGKTLDKWIKSNDRVFSDQAAIDELPNRVY